MLIRRGADRKYGARFCVGIILAAKPAVAKTKDTKTTNTFIINVFFLFANIVNLLRLLGV
jgi:hypothetical protein